MDLFAKFAEELDKALDAILDAEDDEEDDELEDGNDEADEPEDEEAEEDEEDLSVTDVSGDGSDKKEITVFDDIADHIVCFGYYDDMDDILLMYHDAPPNKGAIAAAALRVAAHTWPERDENGRRHMEALFQLADVIGAEYNDDGDR